MTAAFQRCASLMLTVCIAGDKCNTRTVTHKRRLVCEMDLKGPSPEDARHSTNQLKLNKNKCTKHINISQQILREKHCVIGKPLIQTSVVIIKHENEHITCKVKSIMSDKLVLVGNTEMTHTRVTYT